MSELDFSDFLHELHLEGPGFSWMSPESIMHKRTVNVDVYVDTLVACTKCDAVVSFPVCIYQVFFMRNYKFSYEIQQVL